MGKNFNLETSASSYLLIPANHGLIYEIHLKLAQNKNIKIKEYEGKKKKKKSKFHLSRFFLIIRSGTPLQSAAKAYNKVNITA